MEGGVTEFVFEWKPYGSNEPLHWRSRDRDHYAILGIFLVNVAEIRPEHPFAYILTNNAAEFDPRLPASSLASFPQAKLSFDYFLDSSSRVSWIVELGTGDLVPYYNELVGLVPAPEYWALLLSRERGLCPWVGEIPFQSGRAEAWVAKMLERFDAFVQVHEGLFLRVLTRDRIVTDALS